MSPPKAAAKVALTKQQILTFLAPVIAIASGGLASWLFVHIHVFGIFHVQVDQATRVIASSITFAVTTGLVWLGHHEHWLPIATRRMGVVGAKTKAPVNEIVAFIAPYISVAVGAVVAWLFVHLHFLGFFHLSQGSVAQTVASGVVFAVSAAVTWAAHHFHWLPIRLATAT